MKMSNREEREKWIASEYVSNGFGKLAGSKYQYELSEIEENKWKLWPVCFTDICSIYGSTAKECLEAVWKIDEPELEAAMSAEGK
jgi:hypothetical protein